MHERPRQLTPGNGKRFVDFGNRTTVRLAKRQVTLHTVTSGELDAMASLGNSVHLTLFGICVGGFIAFGTTTLTVSLSSSLLVAGFASATIVSALGGIFFGVMARISYKRAQQTLMEVKRGTRGTMG